MFIKQISVFLENKAGRLSSMAEVLGKEGVNIRTLSMAETADFGIIRMIVDCPEKAAEILKSKGFSVKITSVVAIEVDDRPCGLAAVLKVMEEANVNVEYMYAFVEKKKNHAIVIFRFEDIEKAVELLLAKDVKMLREKEVLSL